MLSWSEQARIRIAADDLDIPMPQTVTDAEALREAAGRVLDDVAAEVEPDIGSMTVKNVKALHAALVAWPEQERRRLQAVRLVESADGRIQNAWDSCWPYFLQQFRGPFNTAAQAYLGGDRSALELVGNLARVRDFLVPHHQRAHMATDALEPDTRVLVIPSQEHSLRIIPVRSNGMERYSPGWFDMVVASGCEIEWHTPAEQQAMTIPGRVDQSRLA